MTELNLVLQMDLTWWVKDATTCAARPVQLPFLG